MAQRFLNEELAEVWSSFLLYQTDPEIDDRVGYDGVFYLDLDELLVFSRDLYDDFISAPDRHIPHIQSEFRRINAKPAILLKNFAERHTWLQRTYFSEGRRKIREEDKGQLVVVRGQLISTIKEKKTRYSMIAWKCGECGALNYAEQPLLEDLELKPRRCETCHKVGKPWEKDEERSVTEDYVQFVIQENDDENLSQIRVIMRDARRINQHKLVLGEEYVVAGVLRVKRESKNSTRGYYFIDALSVEPLRKVDELSDEYVQDIQKLAQNPHVIDILKAHIAPDIWGWDDVKEMLLLQQVGGTSIRTDNGTIRTGNLHILLIGDPGTAKTEFLRSVQQLAPKAVAAVGTASTRTGLTVSAVKDSFTGEWTYLAGVLPRANGGIAIIDEMDKMPHSELDAALLQVMVEERASKATAAGVVDFKASAAVLAGANPKYGKWDDTETLETQVDLTPQLFSRFDFIYVMKDVVDEERDRQIARAILTQGKRGDLDNMLFKNYVAFVRQLRTVMTKEAVEVIQEYYTRKRNESHYTTHRMVITLHKLATAYAKLRMHTKVSKEDAELATAMYERALASWGGDYAAMFYGFTSEELEIRKEIFLLLTGGKMSKAELITQVWERTDAEPEKIDEVLASLVKSGAILHKSEYYYLNLEVRA